jgi:molybdopterin-guanine dinucleotide biosynthesis protein A
VLVQSKTSSTTPERPHDVGGCLHNTLQLIDPIQPEEPRSKREGIDLLFGSFVDVYHSSPKSPLNSKRDHVTGIILAGGKGRRIAANKALLPVGNRPIIVDTMNTLRSLFNDILIITNTPEAYTFIAAEKVRDLIPEKGPLGGLYTGLTVSRTEYSFVVACDMPFLNTDLILYMLDHCEGFDVVVPHSVDGLEPLHAIYSKNCLEPILRHVEKGDLKIQSFFGEVKVKHIPHTEIERFDPELRTFFNINDREDYQKVKRLFGEEDPKTWGD